MNYKFECLAIFIFLFYSRLFVEQLDHLLLFGLCLLLFELIFIVVI